MTSKYDNTMTQENWPDDYDYYVWLASQRDHSQKPVPDLPGQLLMPWGQDPMDEMAQSMAPASAVAANQSPGW